MSSSTNSEEEVKVTRKVVRRKRKRVNENWDEECKVNLYSHSVLPKIKDIKLPETVKVDATESPEEFGNKSKKLKKEKEVIALNSDNDLSISSSPTTPNKNQHEESVNLPTPPQPQVYATHNKRLRNKINKLKNSLDQELSKLDRRNSTNEPVIVNSSPVKVEKTMFIKIRLHGEICKYPLKLSENFEMIIKNIGLRNNVSINRVLIMKEDTRVLSKSTPKALNLSVTDILECVILEKESCVETDKTIINVQMQCSFQRTKISYPVGTTDPLQVIMEKYAEHIDCGIKKLMFKFDGERIKGINTPEKLEMTDGDCIDVIKL